MMASRIQRKRNYFLLSESSNSECSTPVNEKKKYKRIKAAHSSVTELCDQSTDEDDNSSREIINRKENSVVRTAINDKNAMFKSRNKENIYHANVKPVIESKGKYNEDVTNFRRKYNLDEDSCDSSASSNDHSSNRMNNVEVMGNSRKIANGTSAKNHDASNSLVTSTPLLRNKQRKKKNQKADTNIRQRIMKMAEELKYILSKCKLEVQHFQLKYLEDEIVTKQESKDIMHTYNSIINKLINEVTAQQQISMNPYHRSDETDTHSRSSSEIFPANRKSPELTRKSKPDVTDNVNKQPLEANCTSAVTVENNNNIMFNSDENLSSILHRLKEINVVKTSSTSSVASSISTACVPDLEVLNRAYKKSIGPEGTTKQDSLRNGHVKEKSLPTNYNSDVNSTCSTVAFYPRKNRIIGRNNYQGGLTDAGANKDVSSRDVSNRDVSKNPISDVSSGEEEESIIIPLTNIYTSDSEGALIISNNKIQNLKRRSKDHITGKGKIVLTSTHSESIRPKQQSEFVVPDINNLSTNRSAILDLSPRVILTADSVPKSKQTQYNTRVDEKLRMNCQVVIEKFRISLK